MAGFKYLYLFRANPKKVCYTVVTTKVCCLCFAFMAVGATHREAWGLL